MGFNHHGRLGPPRIMKFLVGRCVKRPQGWTFRVTSTGNRPGPEAASGLVKAGKVWDRSRDRTPGRGLAAAGNRARTSAAAFTASEESGVYVGRPKK